MKIKIYNSGIPLLRFGRLFATLIVGAVLCACSEKFEVPEGSHLHNFGPVTLEVPLGASDTDARTRAANFPTTTNFGELWVGVFDATDNHIVGFGTRETGIAASTQITIENLFFDDGHQNAFVAAVANYQGVNARLGAGETETKPLIDILRYDVANWEDFCNVAVDVVSAENAIGNNNHVLMSGIYASNSANHYVTRQNDGTFTRPENSLTYQLFTYDLDANGQDAVGFEKKLTISSPVSLNSGYIYMRPMFSHVNVNVDILAAAIDRNGGVEWQLCNVPRYVYLIEHATIEDCSPYTAETWPDVTPAASDLYEDGYYTMTGFTNGTTIEPDAPYDIINEAVTGGNGTYRFGFWHYENKHWGLASATNYAAREATFPGTDIFSSLCPSADRTFNNNATYFVLRTRGTNGANYDFRVHEGYATNAANTSNTGSARDFSTFRNVNYNYRITINGVGSALSPMSTRSSSDDIDIEVDASR